MTLPRKIDSHRRRIDALFAKAGSFPIDDLELSAHWARYLCVLSSGYVEVSAQEIYLDYARSRAAPEVVAYVQVQLSRLRNLKMENLCQLAGCFDERWASELRTATEGRLKDAVDSLVNNRNQIAHGGWVGISYHQVSDYYQDSKAVIELLAKQCDGEVIGRA